MTFTVLIGALKAAVRAKISHQPSSSVMNTEDKTDLPGKMCQPGPLWSNFYGITNHFLIGFGAFSTERNVIP